MENACGLMISSLETLLNGYNVIIAPCVFNCSCVNVNQMILFGASFVFNCVPGSLSSCAVGLLLIIHACT